MTGTTDQTPARLRNPRGEGSRLRVELLDAAVELMAQHGSLDKVSVRAVAAAAGVSPTAVYRHFDNHTGLLWAAVQHCFDDFASALLEAQRSSDDVYERLATAGAAYVRFAADQPGKYRVMFSNQCPLPNHEEPVGMQAFDNLVEMVTDVLVARGDRRQPRFVAVQVWTWIHGIVDLRGSHPDPELWPDVERLLLELVDRLDLGEPRSAPID